MAPAPLVQQPEHRKASSPGVGDSARIGLRPAIAAPSSIQGEVLANKPERRLRAFHHSSILQS